MLYATAQVFPATVVTCLILHYLALLFLMDLAIKGRFLVLPSVDFLYVMLVLPGKHVMDKVQVQSLVLPHLSLMLLLVHQDAKSLLHLVLVAKPLLMAFAFRADCQQRHALVLLALRLSQSALKQLPLEVLTHLEGLNVSKV